MDKHDGDMIEASFSHLNVIEAKFQHLEDKLDNIGCYTSAEREIMGIAYDICEVFREYIKLTKDSQKLSP